jgi:hypothetical protein
MPHQSNPRSEQKWRWTLDLRGSASTFVIADEQLHIGRCGLCLSVSHLLVETIQDEVGQECEVYCVQQSCDER